MRTIWKFPLFPADRQQVMIPGGYAADIVAVQAQGGLPFLWAAVDPTAEPAPVLLRMLATGQAVEDAEYETLIHLDTFQVAEVGLVFHVFKVWTP